MRNMPKLLAHLVLMLAALSAMPAYANCTSPAGKEADHLYNSAYHTWEFCNGTNWIPYQWGTAWAAQANFNPTYPAGSGFFVLSHGTYNGNLGGRTGANSTCLTDLTTNTGWKGYSTANSNGQLISSKVFAFVCDETTCNNLNASTTYYFANAGNASAGGASFTTDSSGVGPYDSANWSAADYFSGSYNYFSNRGSGSNTVWSSATQGTLDCSFYSSSSSGNTVVIANSAQTTNFRWNTGGFIFTCNNAYNLICFVNP